MSPRPRTIEIDSRNDALQAAPPHQRLRTASNAAAGLSCPSLPPVSNSAAATASGCRGMALILRPESRRLWSTVRSPFCLSDTNQRPQGTASGPTELRGDRVRNWHPSDLARGGRAVPLCPGRSDVDLFRDGESVIDLNAEVAHCALDLLVPQHKLHRPQVARAAVDECRLCSAQ